MRRPVALFITICSAIAYGVCFPPLRLRWLAWAAQAPFLLAVRRSDTGTALFLGWVFAVLVAYVTGDWFPRAVSNYYAQPWLIGVAFFFAVSSILAAPWVMVFAVAYRRLSRRFSACLPLLAAAAWVGGELGRTKLLGGCPWAVFGYSQAGVPGLLQVADLTGVYGVSFVLAAVNAAWVEVWEERWRPDRRRRSLAALAGPAAAVAAVLLYGAWRLRPAASEPRAGSTPIVIVQGNLDLGSQWRSEFYGENLDAYLRLTWEAIAASRPLLAFWPESAMTFFVDKEPLYRQSIASVLHRRGVQLVAGGPHPIGDDAPEGAEKFFNSTFLLSPGGNIAARYDKRQLLPFAEYFPLARFDLLRRSFGRVREFTPGDATPPLPTVAGAAGVIVCNEAMFPEPARARVGEGAEYLVNPSNDAWLGDEKFSDQVFDMVTFRAVEQRREVVRTSTSGPSAVIGADGTVRGRTPSFTRTWVAGEVRRRRKRTVYGRAGDVFAWACVVAAASGVVWARRRRRS